MTQQHLDETFAEFSWLNSQNRKHQHGPISVCEETKWPSKCTSEMMMMGDEKPLPHYLFCVIVADNSYVQFCLLWFCCACANTRYNGSAWVPTTMGWPRTKYWRQKVNKMKENHESNNKKIKKENNAREKGKRKKKIG